MAYSQPSDAASTLINITASEQNFDADGTTHLKGNVSVNFLNYRIASPQATISFADGSASVAQFFPGAMAKVTQRDQLGGIGEDTLNADVIKVYLLENRMVGEGNSISHFATIAANPITVQSSSQEFNQKDKTMAAHGNVRVDNNGTILTSPEARVWMAGGKPEKVVFSNGARLAFTDPRRLGRVRLPASPQDAAQGMGPDALLALPPLPAFGELLRRAVPLKALLLDQTVLAGIGNYLADEM
jgi:lipopolysaccharide export system protein LptA